MKKLLCFLGFHKKGTPTDTTVNVWGDILRKTECIRCKKYLSEFIDGELYFEELLYKSTQRFLLAQKGKVKKV